MDYTKISKSIDISRWGSIPIEQVPIWEIRDILSHSSFIELSETESTLVKNIVDNQNYFSWKKQQLSIYGEAKIQQLFRLEGYELLCVELNEFPTSAKELRQYISKYSLKRKIKFNIKYFANFLLNNLKILIMNIYLFLPQKGGNTLNNIITFGLIAYAMYSDFSLLGYALIAAYISSNCMAMVMHEYWVHGQLKPKNRLFGFIFDYLGLLFQGHRLPWKYTHSYHHTHWKTNKDVEQLGMLSGTWWGYLISGPTFTMTKYGNMTAEFDKHIEAGNKYMNDNIDKLLPESQFLEKHVYSIAVISNLLLLLTLGLTVYIYFVFLQIWIFQKYIPGFNELVTHYNNKTREEEADTPYLFPICCGTAYHNTHHIHPTVLVLGPNWVKYFNVQYYFVKLFYRLSPGIRFS